jgi:hypothetical protein
LSSGDNLLERVRGLLERTYGMRPSLGSIGSFVVGDRGYRKFYSSDEIARIVESAHGDGARTLVRETNRGLRLALYFPDAMIRRLELHPPGRGLNDANVHAFATLVEELDHLLLIAERAELDRPVTMFELELHANVSKYLVLSRFLAGAAPVLAEDRRRWLRHKLFDGIRYSECDHSIRRRYEDAAHWAVRFLDAIRTVDPKMRLPLLRRFHACGPAEKVSMIERCAA